MATTARVLFSATSYPRTETDWQGVFIRRMAGALAARTDVKLRMWVPPGPLPAFAEDACTPQDRDFLAVLAAEGGIAHALRQSRLGGLQRGAELVWRLQRLFARSARTSDLFHVNWLQCALGLAGTRTPALVTVLGSDLALLGNRALRTATIAVLRRRRSIVCPNATWMVAPLRAMLEGSGARVACVPFGIDDAWYTLEPRPANSPRIWLVVLRVTHDKIGPLFDWTRALDPAQDEIHLLGPLQEPVDIPPWVRYHGAASPESLLRDWFPRASGVISLSRHAEGRPQVLLEAMASSLPVICSRIPAHEDLVTHGRTGMIVDTRDAFVESLRTLGATGTGRAMGQRTRQAMRADFGTWADCAARYRHHYDELLGATDACAS